MKEYRNQMDLSDPKTIEYLLQYIEELVDKKIANAPYSKIIVGTVTSYDSTSKTATVTLEDGSQLTNVRVTNGLSLSTGKNVHIEYPNNGSKYYIKDIIS